MKKRTVLGLCCVALALVVSFVVAPMVYRTQTETVSVVQLTKVWARAPSSPRRI